MKNIVLLSSDLNIEYCLSILNGVIDFFKQCDDVHLIVTQVKSKDDNHGTYTYQSSMSLDMICAQDIDGYIVLSTSFGDFINELIPLIREKNNSPIVSVGVELPFDNCYSTVCNTKEIYKEIVRHLLEEHGCKRIGFFSANDTKSHEAEERFQSYKEALEYFGIEYNSEYILHGNFTRYFAKKIIAEKYKDKSEIPFDSIICANDLTASGCVEGFSALGVKIPEELKIFGFDNSIHASLSEPSISSISQQFEEQGKLASELIYKKINGCEIEKRIESVLEPVYRQSCGCIDAFSKDGIFKNRKGEVITQRENYREYVKNYYERMADNRNIYVIFDFLHSNETLESFFKNLDGIMNYTGFKGISVCLYENSFENNFGETFILPENVKLACSYDKLNNMRITDAYTFNPNQRLIPKELDSVPGFFILQPIFNCSVTYGYYLARFEEQKLEVFSIHAKIINQGIAQAAELSRTIEKNQLLEMEKNNLAKQSRTDELTKILNRRGFMEYGQQQINLSVSMDIAGSVFFADLDGLKKINDTYGHKMGDLAIQLASQAIKSSFRKADIVGRLSGDEFAVVAIDMTLDFLEKTREKLDAACEQLMKENNLPFTLSISLGGTEYDSENYYLKDLLIAADSSLYEEKDRHHKKLGI